ncbi:MAG: NERD domain-containing protein [Flavobacterium sp.]|nr:NERD domain-containing protein [Flavobacterium sp.]
MNLAVIVLITTFLLVLVTVIYQNIQDNKTLKTVTKLHRGTRTERLMILQLLKSGVPHQAIFHDLYLKKRGENYCQIEIVIATKVGIVVCEIKKYNGWIFGLANQKYWTQVLAYGKRKYRFYNPIMQNTNHIRDLKQQLPQFQNVPFYSLIVFFGNCTFKNLDYLPIDTYLVHSSESIRILQEILNQKPQISYTNKNQIVNLLNSAVQNGEKKEIIDKHIQNIKRYWVD